MHEKETFSNPGDKPVAIYKMDAAGHVTPTQKNLLQEHMLTVYVNEALKMKIVCTPQHIKAMLLGHLYSEGMIRSLKEVAALTIAPGEGEASITLTKPLGPIAGEIEMNSCNTGPWGTLGRAGEGGALIKREEPFSLNPKWLFTLAQLFDKGAPLYQKTHAIHSCLLMYKGELICLREDIGRHNALDKAIGTALMEGIPLEQSILYTSGRMPVDMVKKAIRSGVGLLASNTVPTSEALALALSYGLALIGKVRPDSFEIYTPNILNYNPNTAK